MRASDVEAGGGHVERVSPVVAQEVVQDIGHFMLLIVDNERGGHDVASNCATEMCLISVLFCDINFSSTHLNVLTSSNCQLLFIIQRNTYLTIFTFQTD